MADRTYHRNVSGDNTGASRRGSHFPKSQPQFDQASRPVPTRDRYRSTKYDGFSYDDVEDDDVYGYDEGMRFDSFDERVLQQPFPDRQYQAEQGRARLSLAPKAQVSYQPREYDEQERFEQSGRGQFSRFAYQPQETGEDLHVVPSSSPALRAGQRRAQNTPLSTARYKPTVQMFDDEHFEDEEHESQIATQSNPTFAPSQSVPLVKEQPNNSFYRNYTFNPTVPDPGLPKSQPKPKNPSFQSPVCQGIQLIPVSTLPDRLRTVFPYPTFNAIQSKCFDSIFRSDDNFVLSSPTGSGKTVLLELAICRAVATKATNQYKIVYQAPTKALCSERQRDWEAKFTPLGLKCAELTGDSNAAEVRNVQSANIIITTPEKWDSITRKWKDHERLMRLIKVFLIDEVHILKEDRGAVLETVVSRMKSIGGNVRFVALSATVPNFRDVAAWLGKNSSELHKPATYEMFGEEFRPVKLQKHVYGYASNCNDFAFDKVLNPRLPEVIAKHSEKKPIMIFCATRNDCVATARLVANWYTSTGQNNRKWNLPTRVITFSNKDLRDTVTSGVTFHHAGLSLDDRIQVEKGFLGHDIHVICCTSTLAVGVNLPCHLVIIKNTMTYSNEGLKEYSDLEMMQMLGRAGRPQFDNTAVAVIMTRQTKARRYEMMVTGNELLESKLHSNLIDHMNAEIGLGTIRDLVSARKWLTGTFLYVRLQQNPDHYRLEGASQGQDIVEKVDDICFRDITLLREHNLVSGEEYFSCTEFGHAMARYYVSFDTMKVFMGIESKATLSEILSAVAQASEFSQLRFRAGEKSFYKALNKSSSIRFSIPINLDLPAHKVSLIIQAVLGSADLPSDGEMNKHKQQHAMETQMVFKNVNSLIRCIIDCQIYIGDSVSIHSSLMLERSLGSRNWDDSPLQMKQIDGIGTVAVRRLINAGFRCMEDLETCDAHRIETIVNRNPPFGMKVLDLVRAFPKLRVSLHLQNSSITKCPDGVKIMVKADIGFLNEQAPQRFASKLVYVSLLAETSDGRKMHFARISGPKLGAGQSLMFAALLTSVDQSINCYVMCDSIAGSLKCASVKPQITPSILPANHSVEPEIQQQSNTSRRRTEPVEPVRKRSTKNDEFGDDEIDDDELVKASFGDLDFEHIDNFANPADAITRKHTSKNKLVKVNSRAVRASVETDDIDQDPVQLPNGKWACKHACKDKSGCKHMCCKEGMDKPPKKPTALKHVELFDNSQRLGSSLPNQKSKKTQSKLQLAPAKRKISSAVEELDLTQEAKQKKKSAHYAQSTANDYRDLHQLHNSTRKKGPPANLHSVMHTKPSYCYSQGGEHVLSFLQQQKDTHSEGSSDYGDVPLDDLSMQLGYAHPISDQDELVDIDYELNTRDEIDYNVTAPVESRGSDIFGDDDSLLGDAMVGLADCQTLKVSNNIADDISFDFEDPYDMDVPAELEHANTGVGISFEANHDGDLNGYNETNIEYSTPTQTDTALKPHARFANGLSNPEGRRRDFKPAKALLKDTELQSIKQPEGTAQLPHQDFSDEEVENDIDALMDLFDQPDPPTKEKEQIPEAYKDLEPWLFQEFGDIVELVDG